MLLLYTKVDTVELGYNETSSITRTFTSPIFLSYKFTILITSRKKLELGYNEVILLRDTRLIFDSFLQ